ncbi:MAG: transaldolase family protein [Patescibacteria group bacterium]
MERSDRLKSKIFLDSGSSSETAEAINLLGFLDGQTTNPTLISKNTKAKERLQSGGKFTDSEIYAFYKSVVTEIAEQIPQGSVSIEVYADSDTSSEQMYTQALEMYNWIPNAHIKFPTNRAGLEAASRFSQQNSGRVNMTLGFTQDQGAAVYSATKGAGKGQVYYSSFVGRLFDKGIDGIEQLANCKKMYSISDNHVEVLACSFRNLDQFLASLYLGVDIITASLDILKKWADTGFYIPDEAFNYESKGLVKPEYKRLDLDQQWDTFEIENQMTNVGIEKFAKDWNALVS